MAELIPIAASPSPRTSPWGRPGYGFTALELLEDANSLTREDTTRAMNNTRTDITKGYALAEGEGEGERIWIVGDTMTFKATAASTGGSFTVLENVTAPGGGPPPHFHTREDEFWYVLDGTFEIRIGDEVHAVGPGGFAYGPRGTVHNFRNTAETPSRILLGFAPGGVEGFFRESGVPASDDGPAPPFDEDQIARAKAAAPKYGIEIVA
jgi:mannose-6-phosphate isomerase-like protein (cupin superfamily)